MKNVLLLCLGFFVLLIAPVYAQNGVEPDFMIRLVVIQTAVMAVLFGGFLWVIVRGIDKIMSHQQTSADFAEQEQALKKREVAVVINMIQSEIEANLSKIEAYITIYNEMLAEIHKNPKTPRYKKMGDILQKQPALQRTVFESNADKIQVLDEKTASRIIHFYARIKTEPDYENIEPAEDVADVIAKIEDMIDYAEKLKTIAEAILNGFDGS